MKKLVSLLLGLTLALSLSLPALAADTLTDGSVTVTVDGEAVTEVPVMVPLRPVAEALGFTVLPSSANFLFAKSDSVPGGELYRRLKENGILVRWFDADRIRDYVRITIGSLEQMVALVDQLDQMMQEL